MQRMAFDRLVLTVWPVQRQHHQNHLLQDTSRPLLKCELLASFSAIQTTL